MQYAQGEFDKYDTAVTAGEASYAETIAPMAAEKEDLVMQQSMIEEIVKLISEMAQVRVYACVCACIFGACG